LYTTIITAALGWSRLGKKDFARHVLVLERWVPRDLPTLLIKMSPWTKDEVKDIYNYMNREQTGHEERMPRASKPSERIYAKKIYRVSFRASVNHIHGMNVLLGLHGQEGLDYDVRLRLFDANGELVGLDTVNGDKIKDNSIIDFQFPEINNCKNKLYYFELSSDNQDVNKGFSVWLNEKGKPAMQTIPRPPKPAYNIVFNPLDLDNNMILARFLEQNPSRLSLRPKQITVWTL
jgi:hypothetical protein